MTGSSKWSILESRDQKDLPGVTTWICSLSFPPRSTALLPVRHKSSVRVSEATETKPAAGPQRRSGTHLQQRASASGRLHSSQLDTYWWEVLRSILWWQFSLWFYVFMSTWKLQRSLQCTYWHFWIENHTHPPPPLWKTRAATKINWKQK